MGWVRTYVQPVVDALWRTGGERKNDTLKIWRELYGGRDAFSGMRVTTNTALEVATVLACVRVKANGIAQVPLKLMREGTGIGGMASRLPARDHGLYDLLHRRPNDFQTSFEFRHTVEMHRQLLGNAFIFTNRAGDGRVLELIQLDPGRVEVKQEKDWRVRYFVTALDGTKKEFPPSAIWHLRGPSWDGVMGLEIIRKAREAIGLAMATEQAHARLHRNGVQASGLYSVDGPLDGASHDRLKAYIEQQHAGVVNSGKPFILDRGAKWYPLTMTGVDAQHLETRRYQVEEICRFFNIFPQMVGFTDKTSTYASAEQFFGAHVVHCLGPEFEAWEQSMDCNLLSDAERRDGLYTKFSVAGLLRGSTKDRADFYTKLYGIGVLNPNDIRALEDWNPYEGGDQYRVPLNMVAPSADPVPDPSADNNTDSQKV